MKEFWWIRDSWGVSIAEVTGNSFDRPGCEVPGTRPDNETTFLARVEVPPEIAALLAAEDNA